MPSRARKRRRKSWYFIWTVVFLLFLASLASLIITLPVFKIQKVEVTGARLLSPESIIKLAGIPIGENIFMTRFNPALNRIRSISAVFEVKISRRLPDTVLITVKERKEAAVTVIDDQSVLVDEEGVILNPQKPEAIPIELPDISNLPVIVGVKKEWIQDGARLKGDVGESAARLLSEFKNYVSPHRLEIDLTDSENIILIFDDTLRVKFGDAFKIDLKFREFEAIYKKLKDKKDSIEYIDVRYPGFPAVKFKS